VRIFKTYGSDAIQVTSEDPYRLAREIRGIGFQTAGAIPMKLGIEKSTIIRIRAGITGPRIGGRRSGPGLRRSALPLARRTSAHSKPCR
jgi:hypothetical protein